MLDAATHAAVLGGDVVDRDDAVAGSVLLIGAVVAFQHEGVRMGVVAQAVHVGVLLRLFAEEGDGGRSQAVLGVRSWEA